MKCPHCGHKNTDGAAICEKCKKSLSEKPAKPAKKARKLQRRSTTSSLLLWILSALIALPIFVTALYKGFYWAKTGLEKTPLARKAYRSAQVEETLTSYNMPAHAITVFGNDGDIVYIDELSQGYVMLGGLVRIEVDDSFWFDLDPEDIARADIRLTPTLYHENGAIEALPIIEYSVDTPYTPVTLNRPTRPLETVYSSVYLLQLHVVPGSTVLINGEDVTDTVDREGALDVNVNVLPQGDNRISLYASTPHHKDTRLDIVLHRPVMEIPLELSANTQYSSTRTLLEIKGTVDPTAAFVVDTAYDANSLSVDPETGEFTFKAKFSKIGYNTVRFHAEKEGLEDSIISFQVYYLPSIAEYSRNAWIMDYAQLRLLYEQWLGRVFQCIGTVYDVFTKGDTQYVVMNVGNKEDIKLIVLENMSNTASFDSDVQYRVYADVAGDYYYDATDYPLLVARYVDVYVPKK